MTCHIRQSNKLAKVHAGVTGNKPKETPRLKSKCWFTLLDLYPQTIPPPNQSCSSHPLISPPQLGHALCFPHPATSYQMLLCLSSATLSWCRADLAGFEGCRGYLCRYRAAHTPKEMQKPLFSLAPMQWKKTGKKFYLFSLSHSSKIKARERLPLPHWLPFWEI